MYWRTLDKIDSNLYKGMAILMIVSHNFMHLFLIPKENEFDFNPDRFFNLLTLLLNEPENVFRVTLSFFGHFGVQIFVFLSAYGLTKKYFSSKPIYWPFIFERILKIFPAFILAILVWATVISIKEGYGVLGPLKMLYWNVENIALKLTLLSNFIPGASLALVGPWWFIPFIFQFYALFPLLLYMTSKYGNGVLLVISIVSILFSAWVQGNVGGLNIYFTVLGHLPEFCLGIYLARKGEAVFKVPVLIFTAVLGVYILGNVYEAFWYANHISFLVILLILFSYIVPKIKGNVVIRDFFMFFGSISMCLFLVNGFLRQPFISWAKDYNHWLVTIVLCLLHLLISVLVALVVTKIEIYLRSKVRRGHLSALFRIISGFKGRS